MQHGDLVNGAIDGAGFQPHDEGHFKPFIGNGERQVGGSLTGVRQGQEGRVVIPCPIDIIHPTGQRTVRVPRCGIQVFPITDGKLSRAAISGWRQLTQTEIGGLVIAGEDRSGAGIVHQWQFRAGVPGPDLNVVGAGHEIPQHGPIDMQVTLHAGLANLHITGDAVHHQAQIIGLCRAGTDFQQGVTAADQIRLVGQHPDAKLGLGGRRGVLW